MPPQEVQPWWYIKHALWNIWLLNAAIYISWQGLPDQSCEATSNNNTRWPVQQNVTRDGVMNATPLCRCQVDTRDGPSSLQSGHTVLAFILVSRCRATGGGHQHNNIPCIFIPFYSNIRLKKLMKLACFSVICAYLTEWWRNDECRVLDPGIPCVNITSHHLASLAQTDDAVKKWVLNEYK